MPPKGWKRWATEASVQESAVWKRLFFKDHVFQSVETLVQAAVMGGMAKAYVEGVLALGHSKRKRKNLSMLSHALTSGERPPWMTSLLSSLWLIYSAGSPSGSRGAC